MKRYRLPFISPLALAAAVAAIGAIALAWWLSDGAVAMPGPLSHESDGEAHHGAHRHADLDCGACHTGVGGGAMSPHCLACHDDTRAEISAGKPLHGKLPRVRACLDCHTEHTGGDITRVDRRTFPHEATGFALTAHEKRRDGARFRCSDCHTKDVLHFARDRCSECHSKDPHDFLTGHVDAYGNACRGCHDGVDRFSKDKFDHGETEFALDGKHAKTKCERCHEGAHDLHGFDAAPHECIGCHRKDDAHHGKRGDKCGTCHTTTAWKPAKARARRRR